MKNKYIIWIIALLIIANVASISIFWFGRLRIQHRPAVMAGNPKDYIIKELGFNAKQQKLYTDMVAQHRQAAEKYQDSIRMAKDAFFDLLKDPAVTENAKKAAAAAVSKQTEKLDLLTFAHFQKIRTICTDDQKKKFDGIIQQVLSMMGRPKPPGAGISPNGPPQDMGRDINRPRPNGQRGDERFHHEGPPPGGPDGYGPPDGNGPPDRNGPPPGRDGMPPPRQ